MATQVQYTAIDGDGHMMENPKRLAELLEDPYREFRHTPVESSALVPLDGVDRNTGTRLFNGSARTTQEWLEEFDRGPMAKSVLLPTLGLFSGFVKDPDYQAALCRAYSIWVTNDICEPSGGHLLAVGLLPTHHEDAAEAELRCTKSLGLAASCSRQMACTCSVTSVSMGSTQQQPNSISLWLSTPRAPVMRQAQTCSLK